MGARFKSDVVFKEKRDNVLVLGLRYTANYGFIKIFFKGLTYALI